jgi:ATP-dependent DNA helicase RecQ
MEPSDAARARLIQVLHQYWGYESFLPLQEPAMRCGLAGRDSLVVLPTGGGKSLCFQAPAMCLEGLAIVVSPLISLMKDQTDALRGCGVAAACVHSGNTSAERQQIRENIRADRLRMLYVAPERLVQERMLEFLKGRKVSLIAIDEAHCISVWGHDFRPEYRQLGMLRKLLPEVGIHAYTATATERVRDDIVQQLGLRNAEVLVGSFDRPNLVYRVERRADRLSQIREVLDRHRSQSGVIYCITRKDVDQTCEALVQLGYRARPYHAGMADDDRRRNQDAFIDEQVDTIVATVAFGMGIDKSNVRYVVHAGMPKSVEHYQQESGRAGRDGLEAECCLIYSTQDVMTWKFMLDKEESPPEARRAAIRSVDAMEDFCTGLVCRHRALVQHFGQTYDRDNCGACDICLDDVELVEGATVIGQKILSCVLRLQQRFGADYTANVLAGSKEQRILQAGHDKLSTHGLLAGEGKRAARDWIEQLTAQGYLKKTGEYNVLEVTADGRQLLKGEMTPRLLTPAKKAAKEKSREAAPDIDSWEGVDHGLFEALRGLRQELAIAQGVPPYVIFHDTALRDMARRRPTTLDGFHHVQGVGEKKLADFGSTFVALIVDYCRAQQLTTDITPPPPKPKPPQSAPGPSSGPSLSAAASFGYFRQGLSVEEVARRMGRAASTVNGYLVEFLRHEKRTDPAPWVDAATTERIAAAVEVVGLERLKPIFEALGGSVPYDQLRIVGECLRNAATPARSASEGETASGESPIRQP